MDSIPARLRPSLQRQAPTAIDCTVIASITRQRRNGAFSTRPNRRSAGRLAGYGTKADATITMALSVALLTACVTMEAVVPPLCQWIRPRMNRAEILDHGRQTHGAVDDVVGVVDGRERSELTRRAASLP